MLIVVGFAVGCARKPAALLGTWQFDVDKMVASLKEKDRFKSLPADKAARMEEVARKEIANASMTFADAKFTISTGDKPTDVEYKIVKTEGDKWTLETTVKDRNVNATGTLTWTDNDHFVFNPVADKKDGPTFYLVRKK